MIKNIIILHTDQQRYDSLGCNGNKDARTENIDGLAREGCRFTRHIAASPVCMPSRASLLTGLYVPGHAVVSNGIPLWRRDNGCADKNNMLLKNTAGTAVADKIPTMADIFAENEYRTALFGKLHVNPHLSDISYQFYESYSMWEKEETEYDNSGFYGFQEKKIILGHGEQPCGYNRGHYGRWLRKNYPEYAAMTDPGPDINTKCGSICKDIYLSKLPSRLHNSIWLADEVCEYLEKNKNSNKPGFVFVGFPDPHHPFTPPEDIAEQFLDIPSRKYAEKEQITGGRPEAVLKAMENRHIDREDADRAYRYTMASIHLIDLAVGKIIEKLKKLGQYEDTILVYTSDHGDYMGDFDMICKDELAFHNLLHVPFIIKPTTEMKLPKTVEIPMSNADVLPTLIAMADISTNTMMQGIDIFGQNAKENTPMVTCLQAEAGKRNFSLYDSVYRYTYYPDTDEEELYNHNEDEAECHNLAGYPENRKLCREFQEKLMKKHMQCSNGIYHHYSLW